MEEKKTLEQMVSNHAYDEIVAKVREEVGDNAFEYIFPAVKKALEEGSRKVREEILINWLDCDSVRVCSQCGSIMQEGWYLDVDGYACSDECCMAIMSVDKEEFDRYSIFKPDIEEYLSDINSTKKIEDLTPEEIKEITENIIDNLDAYYYTEWY